MNGCRNRAPYVTSILMQDGWIDDFRTRTPRMVAVPFRMERDCQYTLTDLGRKDTRCTGCKWRPA